MIFEAIFYWTVTLFDTVLTVIPPVEQVNYDSNILYKLSNGIGHLSYFFHDGYLALAFGILIIWLTIHLLLGPLLFIYRRIPLTGGK